VYARDDVMATATKKRKPTTVDDIFYKLPRCEYFDQCHRRETIPRDYVAACNGFSVWGHPEVSKANCPAWAMYNRAKARAIRDYWDDD